MANAAIWDFFDETRFHVCDLGLINMQVKASQKAGKPFDMRDSGLDYMTYGAYKMLGQLDYIPIKPDAKEERGEHLSTDPAMTKFLNLYRDFAGYGATAQIFSDPREHGGGMIFKSREDLERVADEGIKRIKELASSVNIQELNEALKVYQDYVVEVCEKYPRVKPTSKGGRNENQNL